MAAPAPPPVASPGATEAIIKLYLHMQKDAHEKAVAEIRRGRKTSHWIWWEWPAFTPVRTTSRKEFDLPSCGACTAWLAHPTLGTRWADITRLAVGHLESGAPPATLFGSNIDSTKFHESMTLVSICAASPEQRELAERALLALRKKPHEGVVNAAHAELTWV